MSLALRDHLLQPCQLRIQVNLRVHDRDARHRLVVQIILPSQRLVPGVCIIGKRQSSHDLLSGRKLLLETRKGRHTGCTRWPVVLILGDLGARGEQNFGDPDLGSSTWDFGFWQHEPAQDRRNFWSGQPPGELSAEDSKSLVEPYARASRHQVANELQPMPPARGRSLQTKKFAPKWIRPGGSGRRPCPSPRAF